MLREICKVDNQLVGAQEQLQHLTIVYIYRYNATDMRKHYKRLSDPSLAFRGLANTPAIAL